MNLPPIRYLALGDSISFGLGASFFQGYASLLGNSLSSLYPGTSVRNLSKIMAESGNLLFQLKNIPRARYLVRSSNLITISIGGNNLLRGAKNKYSVLNENVATQGIITFANDWPLILQEIRYCLGYTGPIYVMTIYNPCRLDDPRYGVFDKYITAINSILDNREYIHHFGYYVVDVYSLFESNPLKNWTHFYSGWRNIHPNNEGHRQICMLHKAVMEM